MSVRERAAFFFEILLRVPPIYLVDELLKINLGIPLSDNQTVTYNNATIAPVTQTVESDRIIELADDQQIYKVFVLTCLKVVLSCVGILVALCIFTLQRQQLMFVYKYLTSVGIVFLSYWINVTTTKAAVAEITASSSQTSLLEDVLSLNMSKLVEPGSYGFVLMQNYVMQCALAYGFKLMYMGPPKYQLVEMFLLACFVGPSLLVLLPLPVTVLQHAPVFAALLPLALVKFVLCYSSISIIHTLYDGYLQARDFVGTFGFSALVEAQWSRLCVPTVLRVFWIVRVLEHCVGLFSDYSRVDVGGIVVLETLLVTIKNLLIASCETLTAVLGMTSIVSYVCHYIGCFFQWFLLTEEEDDRSIGTVSAILFYILALQTGITSLEPEKRFVRLCRNFGLLFTALLHFIHNIVNPLLMSLSASHSPSLHRHVRALCVCAFLIVFPTSLLAYLWSHHAVSTWLLAVSAFSVEVIVKVVVSLMIYSLFLIDAYRSTFWEKLDDYVYYIRAFGNTVEFFFGIFLFFNGAWILVFESGGAIRAIMMCIHAYFNIWCEARAGWSVFMKRRTAVNKIDSLPEANTDQLRRLDDVCAICYQEMKSAKITRCNHYFHGVCLRKWLYVQDRCPLCHDILYQVESEVSKDAGSSSDEGAGEGDEVREEDVELLFPPGDFSMRREQPQNPDR